MSPEEKQQFFHTALVQYGVQYNQAQEAAQILASQTPDELLTDEQMQMVTEACQIWLQRHKRFSTHLQIGRSIQPVSLNTFRKK